MPVAVPALALVPSATSPLNSPSSHLRGPSPRFRPRGLAGRAGGREEASQGRPGPTPSSPTHVSRNGPRRVTPPRRPPTAGRSGTGVRPTSRAARPGRTACTRSGRTPHHFVAVPARRACGAPDRLLHPIGLPVSVEHTVPLPPRPVAIPSVRVSVFRPLTFRPAPPQGAWQRPGEMPLRRSSGKSPRPLRTRQAKPGSGLASRSGRRAGRDSGQVTLTFPSIVERHPCRRPTTAGDWPGRQDERCVFNVPAIRARRLAPQRRERSERPLEALVMRPLRMDKLPRASCRFPAHTRTTTHLLLNGTCYIPSHSVCLMVTRRISAPSSAAPMHRRSSTTLHFNRR